MEFFVYHRDRPDSVGAVLWRNIVAHATGPVYAVNPGHETLDGGPVFARLTDIGEDVWLAAIAVPAEQLESVIDDCIEARVRGAIVHTNLDRSGIQVRLGRIGRCGC